MVRAEMAEPLTRTAFLQKKVAPMSPAVPGSSFMPRADLVLRHLAQAADEREYQRMIDTETAISSAIAQRITGLLEEGWEWAPGRTGSRTAEQLAEFLGAFMADPELHLSTVLREMLETIFLGWRPCETIWKIEPFDGAQRLVPSQIICHEPWRFRFTVDGKLALLKSGMVSMATLYDLDDPVNALKWQVLTAGTTLTPYGRSWLQKMWLLWFVRHEFTKMSDKAIARSLGIFKAKYLSTGIGDTVPGTAAQITEELQKVFKVLDASNVLVELSGWSLESVEFKTDMVGNMEKLFRYYDDQFRIGIVGQTLTSSQGQRGSQALGRVHAKVLEGFQRSDGRQLQVWMNILARRMVDANFGTPDPRDYPTFLLRAFSRPDLEATGLAYNMGGAIDGKKFAERLNVPVNFDPATGDVVWQRQPGDQEVTMPATQALTTETRPTARAADDNRQASAIEVLAAGGLGPKGVADLYRGVTADLLRANPDPE